MTDEQAKPKKKAEMVQVRVIHSKGETDLVEWVEHGAVQRGYIPTLESWEGKVSKDVLTVATPYGVPWEKLLKVQAVNAETIARNLRNAGIWTPDDLRKHQAAAIGAIQAAYMVTLAACNQAAKEYSMEGDK